MMCFKIVTTGALVSTGGWGKFGQCNVSVGRVRTEARAPGEQREKEERITGEWEL